MSNCLICENFNPIIEGKGVVNFEFCYINNIDIECDLDTVTSCNCSFFRDITNYTPEDRLAHFENSPTRVHDLDTAWDEALAEKISHDSQEPRVVYPGGRIPSLEIQSKDKMKQMKSQQSCENQDTCANNNNCDHCATVGMETEFEAMFETIHVEPSPVMEPNELYDIELEPDTSTSEVEGTSASSDQPSITKPFNYGFDIDSDIKVKHVDDPDRIGDILGQLKSIENVLVALCSIVKTKS